MKTGISGKRNTSFRAKVYLLQSKGMLPSDLRKAYFSPKVCFLQTLGRLTSVQRYASFSS